MMLLYVKQYCYIILDLARVTIHSLRFWIGLILLFLAITIFGSVKLSAEEFLELERYTYFKSGVPKEFTPNDGKPRITLVGMSYIPTPSSKQNTYNDEVYIVTDRRGVVENQKGTSAMPQILGEIHNYPNPFRLVSGSTLGYELNRDVDIDLYIYDARGYLVVHRTFLAGQNGGSGASYNRIPINKALFNYQNVSSGIYFYYIANDKEVLGKGKLAIGS